MKIDAEECIKCGICVPYCPMECINEAEESMVIDSDECVECGICLRSSNCPTDAIYQDFLEMPRAVRKAFSDPFGKHENTEMQHMGRGTEEIKTNDVTGILTSLDKVAVAIEVGRPGIGATFKDVEKLTKAIGKYDIKYEKHNPLTPYILDHKTGEIEPTIMNEKILSGIIEFGVDTSELKNILHDMKLVSKEISTVFSVAIICKVDDFNNPSVEKLLLDEGYDINRSSSKTNMGIGRPKYIEDIKEVEAQ